MEYKNEPRLSKSVLLTSAYGNGISRIGFSLQIYFWVGETKSLGIRKAVSRKPPVTSTTTQYKHLSWTLKPTPAPSNGCPDAQHGHSSLFEKKWGFG